MGSGATPVRMGQDRQTAGRMGGRGVHLVGALGHERAEDVELLRAALARATRDMRWPAACAG